MLNPTAAGVVALLLSGGASAQVICALGSGSASYAPNSDQRPTSDAMQLVKRVNAAAKPVCQNNCPAVAILRNATAPNAMLTVSSGEAKLVYAPQFFATVHDAFGDAGIVALIAHEFGHALDDTLGAAWIQSAWTPELRADSWAGCALAKSELSASEMESALGALAKYPAPAHPGWAQRLPAIRAGYTACGGQASKFNTGKSGGGRK